MSNTFNFSRFVNYLRFDLSRMWKNHTKTAILLGGGSLIVYLLVGIGGLLLNFHWAVATEPVRFFGIFFALAVLQLYMARTYGFVTDRKEGSDFLLIPASTLEKWLSMLLIALVVIPVLFFVAYFAVDGLICLADPRAGESLFSLVLGGFSELRSGMPEFNEVLAQKGLPYNYGIGSLIVPFLLSMAFNYLYYLLCGLVFKRHKILNAFFVAMVLSSVFSLVLGNIIPNMDMSYMNEQEAFAVADTAYSVMTVILGVFVAALAAAVFVRLRKISH